MDILGPVTRLRGITTAAGSLTTCSRADAGAWVNYTFLTQKERDNETGLDYFGARYYGSTMGRFTSIDPVNLTAERLVDPQGLNLYGYVRNNPLTLLDPTGEDIALTGDNEKARKEELEHMRKMLGEERFNLVDYKETDRNGKTVMMLDFGSDANRRKYEAVGGNDAFEVEFSKGMADIIGSKEITE